MLEDSKDTIPYAHLMSYHELVVCESSRNGERADRFVFSTNPTLLEGAFAMYVIVGPMKHVSVR
jgi:hypothetical protein